MKRDLTVVVISDAARIGTVDVPVSQTVVAVPISSTICNQTRSQSLPAIFSRNSLTDCTLQRFHSERRYRRLFRKQHTRSPTMGSCPLMPLARRIICSDNAASSQTPR